MGNSLTVLSAERIPALAEALCEKAREASLDPTLDSPFALLAKENDIMWSGGTFRKDDCDEKSTRCVSQCTPLNLTPYLSSFVSIGMPDDCTVIVAHVVGKSADDTMNQGGL
jgi:protein phosphatase PTC7